MTTGSNEKRDCEVSDIRADRLLNAIDFEIGLSERRNQRPGWTLWAIFGSLGVLVWALFNLLEQQIPSFNTIAVVALLVFLFFDSVRQFATICSPFSTSGSGRLWTVGSMIGTARQLILLHLLRAVLILYLAWCERWCAPGAFHAVVINYGFSFVFFAVALVISFTDLIAPSTTASASRWVVKIFELFGLALKGCALTGFLEAAIRWNLANVHSLRIAGLFVVGLWLLERISSPIHPPLEEKLVDLRRNLALDKIDVPSAAGQFDVIVTGLKVSHVLQREVSNLLASLESSAVDSQLAASEMRALFALIAGLRDGKTDPSQAAVMAKAISGSYQRHLDHSVTELEDSQKGYLERVVHFTPLLSS